ncbi:uncharacterized protein FIBRA_08660 [Fibroporia radiculosa]|uniref:DUF7702 domain-containing protein n=1 Tax=Fibroporia radiculosa TaxID=599839 RepID=J4GX77_9APHY|nr:uncharacterized protein FIBRA_08660 [Fibroporia radiculosa]CCM06400.1 predicted protein [Fibroporia radiculosa]
MTKLDDRGIISVAEIIVYSPILVWSIALTVRHGFTRRAGWVFLVLLALIRIVGGITHIASEVSPTNTTLQIVYSILETSGVSPLLLATLGFLQTVCQNSLDDHPLIKRGLRLMGLLCTVALILAIVGGVKEGEATTESTLTSGQSLRHIAVILFGILYGLIFFVHVFCWSNRDTILRYRRTLLAGISAALPFLAIRVAYTVLSGFAPLMYEINAEGKMTPLTSSSPLKNFNAITGPWGIYLAMSVLPEFISVAIYMGVGTRIPLHQDTDYARGGNGDAWENDEELARLKPVNYGGEYAR